MDRVTDAVRRRFFHRHIKKIACTGGGAFKVGEVIRTARSCMILLTDWRWPL